MRNRRQQLQRPGHEAVRHSAIDRRLGPVALEEVLVGGRGVKLHQFRVADPTTGLHGEARLADTARARDGHQTVLAKLVPQVAELGLPADEPGSGVVDSRDQRVGRQEVPSCGPRRLFRSPVPSGLPLPARLGVHATTVATGARATQGRA